MEGKIIPIEFVTVKDLRREYRERSIDNLKDSQLFGDAEVGLRGGADLYKLIQDEANVNYPDGVYKKAVIGYRFEYHDEPILIENTRVYMESNGYLLFEHSRYHDIYRKE